MLQGMPEGVEDPEAGDGGDEYVYDEDGNPAEYINDGALMIACGNVLTAHLRMFNVCCKGWWGRVCVQ